MEDKDIVLTPERAKVIYEYIKTARRVRYERMVTMMESLTDRLFDGQITEEEVEQIFAKYDVALLSAGPKVDFLSFPVRMN